MKQALIFLTFMLSLASHAQTEEAVLMHPFEQLDDEIMERYLVTFGAKGGSWPLYRNPPQEGSMDYVNVLSSSYVCYIDEKKDYYIGTYLGKVVYIPKNKAILNADFSKATKDIDQNVLYSPKYKAKTFKISVGPINAGEECSYSFNRVWHSTDWVLVEINSISLVFEDGTGKRIANPKDCILESLYESNLREYQKFQNYAECDKLLYEEYRVKDDK